MGELSKASAAAEKKFGSAREKLAENRATADQDLASAFDKLNDSLAKQAALADSRFEKTVEDIAAARKEAADEVSEFRKEFGVALGETTAKAKQVETKLIDDIAKISGEVISLKANQARINVQVDKELGRIEELSNHRFTESKKARGKLRGTVAHNKIEMAKDLTDATEKFYEKLSAQQ